MLIALCFPKVNQLKFLVRRLKSVFKQLERQFILYYSRGDTLQVRFENNDIAKRFCFELINLNH